MPGRSAISRISDRVGGRHVFVERLPAPTSKAIDAALAWLGVDQIVRHDSRVLLKPNLTWRVPAAGVTTTPEFIAAVAESLRKLSGHVTIAEGDGGYHSFAAEEAFEGHGFYSLATVWIPPGQLQQGAA